MHQLVGFHPFQELGDEPAVRIRVELDQEAVGVYWAIAFQEGGDTPTQSQFSRSRSSIISRTEEILSSLFSVYCWRST